MFCHSHQVAEIHPYTPGVYTRNYPKLITFPSLYIDSCNQVQHVILLILYYDYRMGEIKEKYITMATTCRPHDAVLKQILCSF